MDENKSTDYMEDFDSRRPGAIGSIKSVFGDDRNKDEEANIFIEEQIDKVINQITDKLPQEVTTRLDVMGNIKGKLFNYVNHNMINMFNRYLSVNEDEILKKTNKFVSDEEKKAASGYTYQSIPGLIETLGDDNSDFTNQYLEKSIVSMYSYLQSRIEQNVLNLQNQLLSVLDGETSVGNFIKNSPTCNILKCSFKDDRLKPNNVYHCKLAVNVLDEELIFPVYQYVDGLDCIINDVVANHFRSQIENEVQKVNNNLENNKQLPLDDIQRVLEKLNRVENFTDDNVAEEDAKRYSVVAKRLMDKVSGMSVELEDDVIDPLGIKENIQQIVDAEDIRNKGFNSAVNNIVRIVNEHNIAYQYAENLKNARSFIIKEYEDQNLTQLPDERFELKLKYYNIDELLMMRDAYERQIHEFEKEIQKVIDVTQAVYQMKKRYKAIHDFEDLHKTVFKDIKKRSQYSVNDRMPNDLKAWDEIMFVKSERTEVDVGYNHMLYEKKRLQKMLVHVRKLIKNTFDNQNPIDRRTIEERLLFIENKLDDFTFRINPFQMQPGLVLEIDITSIKKKRITIKKMSNILGEFLRVVSKSFLDVYPFSSS